MREHSANVLSSSELCDPAFMQFDEVLKLKISYLSRAYCTEIVYITLV